MQLTIKEAIEKAIAAHKAGRLQDAEKLYKAILQLQPKHPDANHNLGVLTANFGKVNEALPFFRAALASNPTAPQFWISCIEALIKAGDLYESKALLSEAKEQGINSNVLDRLESNTKLKKGTTDPIKRALYLFNSGKTAQAEKVLKCITDENPHDANAYSLLAKIATIEDNLDLAQMFLKAADDTNPDLPSIGWNKARLFLKTNKFLKALEIAKVTFNRAPNDVEGWVVLGECLRLNNKLKESLRFLDKAISANSEYAEAYANRGLVRLSRNKHVEGFKDLEKAFQLKPHLKQVWPSILSLRKNNSDYSGVLNFLDIAIKYEPKNWEHIFQKGSVYHHLNELDEAINCYKQVLKNQPNHAEAHNNLGNAFKTRGQLDEAIESFCRAIEIRPDYSKAYYNKGLALASQFQFKLAINSYNEALKINSDYGKALVEKFKLQAQICDWSELREHSSISLLLRDVKEVVSPFSTLHLEDSPKRHKIRSELYSRSFYARNKLSSSKKPNEKPSRLRIGYFSGEFHSHPVMFLIARLFEIHDRKHFEIFAYSYGSQANDQMRDRIICAVDHFKVLNHLSDRNAAIVAENDKIDIAVELSGYTANGRPGILAYRVAPIQINYLGFPGTMGAEYIDYIIADSNLIPSRNQKYYSEAIIYLPHQYQAQDDTLKIAETTPSRSSLGLPSKGFIFCALHTSYKINPEVFDIWMRLLKHTKNSVLWLLDQNIWVEPNLRKEATNRGINPDRLVFAKRVSHDVYLAQLKHADLFLDTFPYNAGATTSNALWAGLPVITKIGDGYTGRMAGSLLKAIKLPELVTKTNQEYEILALNLAQNPILLADLKIKVAANRITAPLFNSSLFTKDIERSYKLAYELYFKGSKPKSIRVAN